MVRQLRVFWTRCSLLGVVLLPLLLVVGAGSSGSALENASAGDRNALSPRLTARPVNDGFLRGPASIDPILSAQQYVHGIPFGETIADVGARYEVDPLLIASVAEAESSFRVDAVSPKGALGLMQVMPYHVEDGVEPFDPAVNLELGTELLAELSSRYGGRLDLALAAYHAGPGAVERYRGVPPYASTQRYVERVLEIYLDHYAQLVGESRS